VAFHSAVKANRFPIPVGFNPLRAIELSAGFRDQVPDIMEFAISDRYLNRPYMFPRQATLLKIIFLQTELFTQYDHDVIGEWTESYIHTADNNGQGNSGIQPDIMARIAICKAEGRPWFRETLNVSGRRGGKGHIGAYAGAYVLWNYMSWGDPQGHFGIDRDKKLEMLVFAGKKEQAKTNQWKDLTNVIIGAPCFSPYISRSLSEILTVYAPHDFERLFERWQRGVDSEADLATFEIKPKESTLMAARGPASMCLDPSTPVLTSDLRWVPIGDLRPGDGVVGFDEHPIKGSQRKLRDAQVVGTRTVRKEAVRLTFDDGSSVVCSLDHPWLFKDFGKGGTYLWRETRKLRVGGAVQRLASSWSGLASPPGCDFTTLTKIEALPRQELVDIQTTSHTFIANGLFSHNCQMYDEMAHVIATGGNRAAADVYEAATPSLDQFKTWAFLYEPSSPWQRTGQFYKNYERALQKEADGTPSYPEMLMVQLASWSIYKDWERANDLLDSPGGMRLMPLKGAIQEYDTQMQRLERANDLLDSPGGMRLMPLKGAIQEYDTQMQRLERANPETFNVERRAWWATTMNAYLAEEKVKAIWAPYQGEVLTQQTEGRLNINYRAHGDPSKSGAGFGYSIAHIAGYDERGLPHVVFDKIHSWNPADFPGHEVDYSMIQGDIEKDLDAFMPVELTFDQFNSVNVIQSLRKYVAKSTRPKKTNVYERTATAKLNWQTSETFKTALNMGLIHGPYHELADLELRYLQDFGGRIDHPTSGPVQTKDIADTLCINVFELIGSQMSSFIAQQLSETPLGATAQGGFDPSTSRNSTEAVIQQMSGFGRARRGPGGMGSGGRFRRG